MTENTPLSEAEHYDEHGELWDEFYPEDGGNLQS